MPAKSTLQPVPSAVRPALFDLQVNGFAGVDFQRAGLTAAELRRACEGLRAHATHRILLTLITDKPDALAHKLEHCERLRAADPLIAETVVGYHLEGPWLSPRPGFHGAHLPDLMCRPDLAVFHRLHDAAHGRLRLLTLAPELPGSDELIAAARARGIHVSLGHTDASDADIDRAIAAGARLCTHLGNGVPANLPRHDNIIQRLLARDELTACFIPDGIHLPPSALRNFFRAKPAGQSILTTDAMAAAGAPPGIYTLAHIETEVGTDGIVRERGRRNFAGSALTLEHGVAHAAGWLGLGIDQAWALASTAVATRFDVALPLIPVFAE